ncbi:MAG: phosphate signaling complex protein PhoU [Melioribacteraceae bacterium]|nr:phosphate signaling complex protein PhoU [Melioribacteraceae bacterium]MCF8353335.1 phosphate signaling complex protein PhoU [Melioribacteraceae bacterium]MCF8393199.1 phosphate signaling complex protein PhoU [Melioribacteraceae bacterium]MCF8419061.1 phosphate signaling complex protein PhoU [Melioribacteraceae bacterium]
MERPFDKQIDRLKVKLIKMCSLVDEQVEFAIRSVDEKNISLADLVIERDLKVDKYDTKIERICQKLFALNQPVAMDLRLVMSALKINSNLERIGDLAVNISRFAKELPAKPGFYSRLHFMEIAFLTREMIKNAIDAFIGGDSDLARRVLASDDKLDNMVHETSQTLIEIMKEDQNNIEPALKFYSIFQELERLGDHATNISEEVYFIVKARSIKHRDEDDLFRDHDFNSES